MNGLVVAVFVLGKEWQFKDFPFKDHAEIFNKKYVFLFLFNFYVFSSKWECLHSTYDYRIFGSGEVCCMK